MRINETLNKYKRYIVIIGFGIGIFGALGMLPTQPVNIFPPDTWKIFYAILIAGCAAVFLKFFKPVRNPVPPPAPRRIPPRPMPRDRSDVFGDIDNSPPAPPQQVIKETGSKSSIYEGFK